jgi:hypothetical protein
MAQAILCQQRVVARCRLLAVVLDGGRLVKFENV